MEQPYITLLASKHIKALDSNVTNPHRGTTVRLDELNKRFATDIHIQPFKLAGSSSLPRLAYRSLVCFKAVTPMMTCVFLDVDNPGHKQWSDMSEAEKQARHAELAPWLNGDKRGDIFKGCGYYYTRSGMRIIVVLSTPVSVKFAGSFMSLFFEDLKADHPEGLDFGCKDWCRLMRAPFTIRNGEAQEHGPFVLPTATMTWVPTKELVEGFSPRSLGECSINLGDISWETAKKPNKSDLVKLPNCSLKVRLLKGMPLETVAGKRHDSVVKAATKLAHCLDIEDPLVLFNLIAKSVVAMMSGRPNIWSEAVDICQWICAHRIGAREQEQKEEEEQEVYRRSMLGEIAHKLGIDKADASQWLIIYDGTTYFVYNPNANRWEGPATQKTVMGYIRDLLSEYVRIWKPGPKGTWQLRSIQEMLADYGTAVSQVRYSYVDDFRIDHPNDLRRRTLLYNSGIFPKFEPVYDEAVANYLKMFPIAITDWFSCVPNLDKALPMMIIESAPGIGKSVITSVISRFFGGEHSMVDDIVGGDFNGTLERSPAVFIDEGSKHCNSDWLRRAIGGNGKIILKRKHISNAVITGNLRLAAFANNVERVVKFPNQTLNRSDVHALEQRMFCVSLSAKQSRNIAQYMIKLNQDYAKAHGFDWSDQEAPRRISDEWIHGDSFCQHIMWLNKHHKVSNPCPRFMMKGPTETFTKHLQTSHGITETLLMVVAKAIQDPQSLKGNMWLIGEDHVWLRISSTLAQYKELSGKNAPNPNTIQNAIRSLSQDDSKEKRKIRVGNSTMYFWPIPAQRVAETMDDLGIGDGDSFTAFAQGDIASLKKVQYEPPIVEDDCEGTGPGVGNVSPLKKDKENERMGFTEGFG